MRNLLKTGITVAVLFFAVIVAYGLVVTAPVPERIAPEEMATSIRVLTVEKARVRLEVSSQGNVVPYKESELIPEVNGRVKWISPNLVSGGLFEKDEVLLRIDDRDYRSVLARGQASLSRARAEEELARFELQRMQELVKKKLTSQSSVESKLRNHRIAEAALQEAKISLELAQRDLWRTEIKAPYDGLIRTERVDVGQYVSRGQSIASVYASDSAEVRLPIADRQLAYLELPIGYRGELAKDATTEVMLYTYYGGEEYQWLGKLVRTEAEIDSKSRMVTVIVRVENSTETGQINLPIGLFVSAKIMGKWVENVITLPRAALRNQNQVLVIDEENRIFFRDVDVLRFEDDNVLITDGLDIGELVNVSPLQTIVEGMRVNPVQQSIIDG